MSNNNFVKVHWSFWLIGVLALLWYVMGCINYLMQTNTEMLAKYPEPARLLVETRPAWATGAFAISVFGGALGSLFILLGKSAALYLYVASLLGVIATNLHTFSVGASTEIWVGSAMSFAVAVLLIWYSHWVKGKRWTR